MKNLDFGPLTSNAAKLFKDIISGLEDQLDSCRIVVIGNYDTAPTLSDGTVLTDTYVIWLGEERAAYYGTCEKGASITIAASEGCDGTYFSDDISTIGTIVGGTEETIVLNGSTFICENIDGELPARAAAPELSLDEYGNINLDWEQDGYGVDESHYFEVYINSEYLEAMSPIDILDFEEPETGDIPNPVPYPPMIEIFSYFDNEDGIYNVNITRGEITEESEGEPVVVARESRFSNTIIGIKSSFEINIENNILTWPETENATGYSIYADGSVVATVEASDERSFDLTTLIGSEFVAGTTYQINMEATGVDDNVFTYGLSNTVSYTAPSV